MRRLALFVALFAAALAGTARADTFVVVPEGAAPALPSAGVPGLTGGLAVTWTSPPAVPQQLEYAQLVGIWQHAGTAYGIPWQVLASINKIESNFGRNMGPSSAGAIGWMQFMPSTWERWGTDANGDGIADPWNAEDAIHSAARYLAASGGASDLYRAIYAYNHADWYVQEVLDTAKLFGDASVQTLFAPGSSGLETVFTLDRLQVSLDQARSRVKRAASQLRRAQAHARSLENRAERLSRRAEGTTLLSGRLDLERRAVEMQLVAGAADRAGDDRPHQGDGDQQSAMGRGPHPWRAAQARDHGREAHDSAPHAAGTPVAASRADLGSVPPQPRSRHVGM